MLIYEFHSPTLHYLFIDLQLFPSPSPTSIWLLCMKHTVTITKCLLESNHHPGCLLLRVRGSRQLQTLHGTRWLGTRRPSRTLWVPRARPVPPRDHPTLWLSLWRSWDQLLCQGMRWRPWAGTLSSGSSSRGLWCTSEGCRWLWPSLLFMSDIDMDQSIHFGSATSFSPVCSFCCYASEQQSYTWQFTPLSDCVLGCLWAGVLLLRVLCRVVF